MPRIPFMFAIPFPARCVSLNWTLDCALLACTLRSVLNQSDQDFYVGICCHDTPILPVDIRERVNLVQADFEPPTDRGKYLGDKRRKKEKLARILAEMGGGYYFGLDYDDLVTRDLVAYARAEADPNGYLIDAGYILDAKAGFLAPMPGPPGAWLDRPLYRECGSCAILNLSRSELPGGELFRRNEGLFFSLQSKQQHTRYGADAAAIGRPLKAIPFPAVVYVVNTGNNVSYTVGRGIDPELHARIHSDIARNAVFITRELAEQFALPLPD